MPVIVVWTLFPVPVAANLGMWIAHYLRLPTKTHQKAKASLILIGKGSAFVGLWQACALCALVLLWTGFLEPSYAAELSAAEILGKVSDTYRSLRSCRFVAVKSSELAAVGESRSPGGTTVSNFHKTTETRVELAAITPAKIRLSVKDERLDAVLVSDGRTTWTYVPKKKQYTEAPGPFSEPTDALRLAQYWDLLVGRFRGASQLASSARREKDERVKVGRDKVECYVIKVQAPEVAYELWVDMSRFLVLRFRQIPLRPLEGIAFQTAVTVSMVEADLNTDLEDSLFSFTPPEDATKVLSLNPSGK